MAEIKRPKSQIGRLAYREEGVNWCAYWALTDTMEGSILIASIAIKLVHNQVRKAQFMKMTQDGMADLVEEMFGVRPTFPNAPEPAGRSRTPRSPRRSMNGVARHDVRSIQPADGNDAIRKCGLLDAGRWPLAAVLGDCRALRHCLFPQDPQIVMRRLVALWAAVAFTGVAVGAINRGEDLKPAPIILPAPPDRLPGSVKTEPETFVGAQWVTLEGRMLRHGEALVFVWDDGAHRWMFR